jgi:hypothetical protein
MNRIRQRAIVAVIPLFSCLPVLSSQSKSSPVVPNSAEPVLSPLSTTTPSSFNGDSPTAPALRESIVREASPPLSDNQENGVDSFFQCGPIKPLKVGGDSKTSMPQAASSPAKQPRSLPVTAGRVVWHILDNIGVPMLIGKDNDLDPSIDRQSSMPPMPVSTKVTALKKSDLENISANQATRQSVDQSSVQANTHRIPESELEGVELPAPKDATP